MHMKRSSSSLVVREMQIEITVRCHVHYRTTKSKRLTIPGICEDSEKKEISFIPEGNVKWHYFRNEFDGFLFFFLNEHLN